jgi:WD40 repeat protein
VTTRSAGVISLDIYANEHQENVVGAVAIPMTTPMFLSGSEDGCLAFWWPDSKEPVAILRAASPSTDNSIVAIAAFQGNDTSHTLVTAHGDGEIRLWNISMESGGVSTLV